MALDQLPGSFFGPPTLVDLVRHRAEYQPDDIAFTYLIDGEDDQIHLTNRELDRRARAIGAWLGSLDLVGERALLLYPAGLDFITAFFGCIYAGIVAVPAYPPRRNRSADRIQAIAADAEAKIALTTDKVLSRIESVIDETPRLKQLTWLSTDHTPEGIERQWEIPDVSGDTLAFLQYTSGSTGAPKGVILNHTNLVHNSAVIAHAFEHTRTGVGVFWLPSYHDMGLIGGILQPLFFGRPSVLMSPMAFLTRPYRWLRAITRFGGTSCGGPNFAYDLCVRKIRPEQLAKLDLSSWEIAFNGAEPVREETIERFVEKFAPCGFRREAFYPCYGLAEATLLITGGYANRDPDIRAFDATEMAAGRIAERSLDASGVRKLVGCGCAMPDGKIVIVDPHTMTRCPDDRVGEIWAASPSIAQGYWRNPEATEEIFHAHLKDSGEGPFLRTGDLGFVRDNELFVTGRIKDLIILHGVNLYPQDIELTVQNTHKGLRRDAGAAFSIETVGGEKLVIVQELERRTKDGFDEIFNSIRRAVSAEFEMAVDAIVLVKYNSIPQTSSGKIQRHACRKRFLDGSLTVIAQWEAGDEAPPIEKRPATAEVAETEPARTEPAIVERAAEAEEAAAAPGGADGRFRTDGKGVTEIIFEEVRTVARERADGLTLDSPITEIGLDSLERMEILASIEDRFGSQFPMEILPELETARQLVGAVEKYLGTQPREHVASPADAETPEENYRFDKLPEYVQLRQSLDLLESIGMGNTFFTVHQGITNDRAMIDGREYINFSSYNYIGMSGDPVVIKATQEGVAKYGASVSASRLVSGQKDIHVKLEETISDFVGTETALVFAGGHSTNETVIGHLLGPGDLILHDALSHNSILQGAILSGARRRPFEHNNFQAADWLLSRYRHVYRRVLIVIEGVYSMDGDIPNLPEFIDLRNRHKTYLMIDEAHSMGVLGDHGRGIGEYYDVDRRDVDIWMGTLSKSFGACGGFIAGCKELIEYLKYTAPGFVFAAGLSPPNAAAALASLELLKQQPERTVTLQRRSELFLELAKKRGLDTGLSHDSPVVPVILGNSLHALQLSHGLFERGVNVQPILHPAVPESAARLRYFITCLHTEEQIRYTINAMVDELRKIDPKYLGAEKPTAPSPVDSEQPVQ